ncbi:NarK/NasA family nitrate transporter [Cryobacterium sp. TMT1-3]|uniref:NarK/NasA family nitrate transporter n=1 Tax=Cryobacterium luteum TaxID=1424661 RepID=A0A1H8DE35_9MICO|nr:MULTISPECIES: MFS transporter [Cryobacterium]TFB82514.1 NarK/NasA family nitrate transporter [Cryobacterium luteum]TFC31038.1 NarK/NasA family nitrate transporter [Cryobacterium sp. TMT1-3]SEN05621.1 MFS transporter, NNP family, nitrate/nitrite transporter [Cryobacterium luteum]
MAETLRERARASKGFNLVLATLSSVVCFWAWTSVAPLGVRYSLDLELTSTQASILVAMPVFVGSIGRIPVGVLTDRFGGPIMFTAVLLGTVPALLLVALAGTLGVYWALVFCALLLGVAGTVFAVGIPFVSTWYELSRRGFATGIFGAGMGGTALSAFFTPRFVTWFGYIPTHLILAGLLVATAVLVRTCLGNAPSWVSNTQPFIPKLLSAAKLGVTWQMCFLYGVVFGGFVAFSTYLPTYLRDIYDFDLTAAGTRTAGFAVAAVLLRPVGGILADRIGPKPVVIASLAAVAVLAWLVNLRPDGEIPAGLTFVAMASALGLGAGGVFAWLGRNAPPDKVGSVSGIVSAAGGLGGYFPPLVMGATYNAADNSYAIGLLLLAGTAAVALVFTIVAVREHPTQPAGSSR